MIATSAVPFIAVGFVLALAVGVVQARKGWAAFGGSSSRVVPVERSRERSISCGLKIKSPGSLDVSYPLARFDVQRERITLRSPLGSWQLVAGQAMLTRPMKTGLFYEVNVTQLEFSAIVFIRTLAKFEEALAACGWEYYEY